MQMARLWHPSLPKDYSLENLAAQCLGDQWSRQSTEVAFTGEAAQLKKVGASLLQSDANLRSKWVEHASFAAAATFHLYEELQCRLKEQPWEYAGPQGTPKDVQGLTMLDFYSRHWLPLGPLLSDMEVEGFPIDRERLHDLTERGLEKQQRLGAEFKQWVLKRLATERGTDEIQDANLHALNLNSTQQLAQLFFGKCSDAPVELVVTDPEQEAVDEAEQDAVAPTPDPERAELEAMVIPELKKLCKSEELPMSGKKRELVERLLRPRLESKTVPQLLELCEERGLETRTEKKIGHRAAPLGRWRAGGEEEGTQDEGAGLWVRHRPFHEASHQEGPGRADHQRVAGGAEGGAVGDAGGGWRFCRDGLDGIQRGADDAKKFSQAP